MSFPLSYFIAGQSTSPLFARAECDAHTLEKALPFIGIKTIIKHPNEWRGFIEEEFKKNGFPKPAAKEEGPLIWTDTGILIGDLSDFSKELNHKYSYTSELMEEESRSSLDQITHENHVLSQDELEKKIVSEAKARLDAQRMLRTTRLRMLEESVRPAVKSHKKKLSELSKMCGVYASTMKSIDPLISKKHHQPETILAVMNLLQPFPWDSLQSISTSIADIPSISIQSSPSVDILSTPFLENKFPPIPSFSSTASTPFGCITIYSDNPFDQQFSTIIQSHQTSYSQFLIHLRAVDSLISNLRSKCEAYIKEGKDIVAAEKSLAKEKRKMDSKSTIIPSRSILVDEINRDLASICHNLDACRQSIIDLKRKASMDYSTVRKAIDTDRQILVPGQLRPFVLEEKIEIDNPAFSSPVAGDCFLLRFALPLPDDSLNLRPGEYVAIVGFPSGSKQPIFRPYTPLSSANAKGHFDIFVQGVQMGDMTSFFSHLSVGDSVWFTGPFVQFQLGRNHCKQLGMIASGSGVIPLIQIVRSRIADPQDSTVMSLVYLSSVDQQSKRKDLLKSELKQLSASHPSRIKVTFSPDPSPELRKLLQLEMPEKSVPSTKLLICGAPDFSSNVKAILIDLNYPIDSIMII